MGREIVFDTETTGMDPVAGHRVIEIGCVEIIDFIPTGKVWHQYLNPERDVPQEAVAVHGLTEKFLSDKPVFSQVFADFLDFIGHDTKLVAHNASFDLKFLNSELRAVGHPGIKPARIVDTLLIAREKFPGAPASLDALCKRFEIDNTNRELHGALLDAQLLAEVYLALNGGRQRGLGFDDQEKKKTEKLQQTQNPDSIVQTQARTAPPSVLESDTARPRRIFTPSDEEKADHARMLEKLTDPLWNKTGS